MPVIQVYLEVPAEIALKIAVGDMVRDGSVVRDADNMQIVKHLDEVGVNQDNLQKRLKDAQQLMQDHKYVLIGIGVAALLAGGAYAVHKVVGGRNKKAELAIPECIPSYNQALANYLVAARTGSMDLSVIAGLVDGLDEIIECSAEGAITIEVSADQLAETVRLVIDYTRRLAEANSAVFESPNMETQAPPEDALLALKGCLEAQAHILADAA